MITAVHADAGHRCPLTRGRIPHLGWVYGIASVIKSAPAAAASYKYFAIREEGGIKLASWIRHCARIFPSWRDCVEVDDLRACGGRVAPAHNQDLSHVIH